MKCCLLSLNGYNLRTNDDDENGRRMMEKKVKLAFIDNSLDPTIYNPVDHWSHHVDIQWNTFRAIRNQFPDLKDNYTHLLLSGSEASIVDREKWVYEETEVVQEAFKSGLSILGSCYGHQLLVLALLGPDHVNRSDRPEVGWIPIQIEKESELLGKPREAFTFSVHFDEVINLSDEFTVLASSKDCEVQAFQMKGRPVWGIQIHPEINVSNAQELLKNLIALNLKTKPLFEKALESKPRDSNLILKIVKTFLASGR